MLDLNSLSGPWMGWSIQYGNRISERMKLTIADCVIIGTGVDKDGEFELSGQFQPRRERVTLTRVYVVTTEPTQSGVGIPYDYDGKWDGQMISGLWHRRGDSRDGGPFEMWPARDEDIESLSLEALFQQDLSLPRELVKGALLINRGSEEIASPLTLGRVRPASWASRL